MSKKQIFQDRERKRYFCNSNFVYYSCEIKFEKEFLLKNLLKEKVNELSAKQILIISKISDF